LPAGHAVEKAGGMAVGSGALAGCLMVTQWLIQRMTAAFPANPARRDNLRVLT
jgi:hypothetical protein